MQLQQKNPREVVESKDKLKAAIEAAVLRKPGIYRKHRVADQSNYASLSNINSEIAAQEQLLDLSSRGSVSASGEQEGEVMLGNSTMASIKQEMFDNNVKQFPVLPIEASTSRTGGVFPVVPLEGSSLVREVPNGGTAATSTILKTLAIPDHEYIWQGIFEVSRMGKPLNLFDGIQAHLSTSASPRVLEAVNKFDCKVLLKEVPRLTMWPVQFQEYGVQEDNVALFFFAKNLASYEKSYKVLLDNMMKYDLALKGSFDGFELMIFPSNQLPEKAQRWNALFFLWGVFRGKRADCSHIPCSDKRTSISQGSSKSLASEVAVSEVFCSRSEALEQGCDGRVSFSLSNTDSVVNVEQQGNKLDSSSFSVAENSTIKSCGEAAEMSVLCDKIKQNSTSPEDTVDSGHNMEQEQTFAESTQRGSGFSKSQEMQMEQNSHLSRSHTLHGDSPAYVGEIGSVGNIGEGCILDYMSSSRYEVSLEDGSLNEASSCVIANEIGKDDSRNRLFMDSLQRMAQAACTRRSQVKSGIALDDVSVGVTRSKKQKTDFRGLYEANDQSSSLVEGLVTQFRDRPSGYPIQANGGENEAFDGCDAQEIKGNGERYFFPVDPHAEKEAGLVRKFMPRNKNAFEDHIQDKAPNLELALGTESTPMTQGTPAFLVGKEDKKIIQDQSSNEAATQGDEDDISASLSLSLSFPFPDKEQALKSLSNTEQLMPESRHANTSLLFGGLRKK